MDGKEMKRNTYFFSATLVMLVTLQTVAIPLTILYYVLFSVIENT